MGWGAASAAFLPQGSKNDAVYGKEAIHCATEQYNTQKPIPALPMPLFLQGKDGIIGTVSAACAVVYGAHTP